MNNPLTRLSVATLKALTSSLSTGVLSHGISLSALYQIVGPTAERAAEYLVLLENAGFTNTQTVTLINTIIESKEATPSPESVFELVLSGPDVPGIHTSDTAATMMSLIDDAQNDLMLVGYAIHNVRMLFEPIARKLETISGFNVVFCLNISRSSGDTSLESEILNRFSKEFKENHWPWPILPDVYYDPRSLENGPLLKHSSLHAKCILTDHKTALVTSANFTEAAQYRNIEAGVQIMHPPMVKRLAGYFEGLIETGRLILLNL